MSSSPALDTAAWSSRWRARATGEKVLLSLGMVLCAAVLPSWPVAPVVVTVSVALMLGPAGVPPRTVLGALAGVWSFLALGAVPLAVVVDPGADAAGVLARCGGLAVTGGSAAAAASTTGHAVAGTAAMLVLATTTPMTRLLRWTQRRGVPAGVVEVADLTYRFVALLLDTASAVHQAQDARLGYRTRGAMLRSSSQLAATVLARAWARARRLQDGLEGRGYTGSLLVLDDPEPWSPRFVALTVLLLAGLVALGLCAA